MKILLTGITAHQATAAPGVMGNIQDQPTALAKMFTELGHEVIRQPVKPGFNASDYGLLLVGLCDLTSMTARTAYQSGVFDLLGRHDNFMVFLDDFAFHNLQASVAAKSVSALMMNVQEGHRQPMIDHWPTISRGCAKVIDLRHPLLMSIKPNGDFSKTGIKTSGEVFRYDPHPFLQLPEYRSLGIWPKQRRWMLTALDKTAASFAKKTHTAWPIDYYGNKDTGLGRITEIEQLAKLEGVWGNLQAPHSKILGAGWFRKTPWFSQRTGTVLCMHPAEAALWGDAYTVASDAADVESLFTETELEDLVIAQADCFWQNVVSKDEQLTALNNLIKEIT